MVVCDRLGKEPVIITLPNLNTGTVVDAFLRFVVAYHWLPDAITSDWGG